MSAPLTLQLGIPTTVLDDEAVGAAVLSDVYVMPTESTTLTWQTIFDTNPGAVSMQILGALLFAGPYVVIDSSTVVGGEIKTIETNLGFVKAKMNTVTGGDFFSVILNAKVD